jgi:hypothetical protein
MQQNRDAAAESCAAMEVAGGATPTHPDGEPAIAAAMGGSLSTVNRTHMAHDTALFA